MTDQSIPQTDNDGLDAECPIVDAERRAGLLIEQLS